jgi:hypothetical protein
MISQHKLKLYFSFLPFKQGIGFYYKHFKNKEFNLLSTMPRSGTHVLHAIMNLCYLDKLGLPSEVHFSKTIPYAMIDSGLLASADSRSFKNHNARIYHTHGGLGETPIPRSKTFKTFCLYRGAVGFFESLLKLQNGYSLVKEYSNINESELYIEENNIRLDIETYYKIEKQLGLIQRYISYSNSTTNYINKNSNNFNYLCYFTEDPKNTDYQYIVNLVSDLFDLNFDVYQIQKACDLLSIPNIQKNKPKDFDFFKKETITLDDNVVEFIENVTYKSENALRELSNC